MHDAQIPYVVPAVPAEYHKLGLPEFLVVGDDEVVAVALAHLVLRRVTVETHFQVLQLLGVHGGKTQGQL